MTILALCIYSYLIISVAYCFIYLRDCLFQKPSVIYKLDLFATIINFLFSPLQLFLGIIVVLFALVVLLLTFKIYKAFIVFNAGYVILMGYIQFLMFYGIRERTDVIMSFEKEKISEE